MEAYAEAQAIDDKIHDLVDKYPISKKNAVEWLNFTRTLETSLNLLRSKALQAASGR